MTTFHSGFNNNENLNSPSYYLLNSKSYDDKKDVSIPVVPLSKKMTIQSRNISSHDSYTSQMQSKYDTVQGIAALEHSNFQKSSCIANGSINNIIMDSERTNVTKQIENNPADISQGLFNMKAIIFLTLWYFFSFTTLFMNKYILAYRQGDPAVLGIVQMFSCALCGYLHLLFPCGFYKKSQQNRSFFKCFFQLSLVGSLRFLTVFLGLIALWYVPVSFAETVKSSAPVFTVVISRIVLGDRTSFVVMLSLIPVMGGLALCSANELSFNTLGFIAAMATNLSECFQNVFSKMLLSGEKIRYSPPELQCYTGLTSFGVQIPAFILMVNFSKVWSSLNLEMLVILALGGISFHCQSIMEYTLLGYISPVTHSVANTTKRALLIWLSVLTFGNKVTFLSGLGTAIVILGVMFYNKAQEWTFKQPMQTISTTLVGTKEGVHTV